MSTLTRRVLHSGEFDHALVAADRVDVQTEPGARAKNHTTASASRAMSAAFWMFGMSCPMARSRMPWLVKLIVLPCRTVSPIPANSDSVPSVAMNDGTRP